MRQALDRLAEPPDHLLIDALRLREIDLPQRPIIDGDAISASIAAASIVAKVTRDRICDEVDRRYPAYGFARHKGYGTRRHVDALVSEGPCEWHRRSFAPIRMLLAGTQLPLDLESGDRRRGRARPRLGADARLPRGCCDGRPPAPHRPGRRGSRRRMAEPRGAGESLLGAIAHRAAARSTSSPSIRPRSWWRIEVRARRTARTGIGAETVDHRRSRDRPELVHLAACRRARRTAGCASTWSSSPRTTCRVGGRRGGSRRSVG